MLGLTVVVDAVVAVIVVVVVVVDVVVVVVHVLPPFLRRPTKKRETKSRILFITGFWFQFQLFSTIPSQKALIEKSEKVFESDSFASTC